MVICKSPTSLHKGHLHPQLLVSLEPLVLVLFGFGRSTVVCFSNISLALCQCRVLFQMEGLLQGVQHSTQQPPLQNGHPPCTLQDHLPNGSPDPQVLSCPQLTGRRLKLNLRHDCSSSNSICRHGCCFQFDTNINGTTLHTCFP